MKNIGYLLLLLIVQVSCTQSKSMSINEFTAQDLENAVLIDVRTPEEYADGHLENAININWYDEDFIDQFKDIEKGKTVYVYCKKGGRSSSAAELLNSSGYKDVVDLLGGYDAYLAKN
ncbi:rhodanese-like domain-containing protein [uncultured Eudoraea sp.]|uniref:rhodanese-like domain-containing protein n=1 Tax=uncultured Eudoraea sp. TaxID=1035614 RepID=UPI002620615A|nr:rhodanese-like domain-containing protein [uncultured Eudoraea sp.]